MYNNDYMYAIERNDEYLAHYGIRGMKWGVRKAIASGNSAKLGRQYAKAQKKLAKLEKQAGKSKKYAKRAALMGAGAAAAGGLAAFGTTRNINNAMRGVGGAMKRVGRSATMLAATPGKVNPKLGVHLARVGAGLQRGGSAVYGSSQAVKQWNRSTSVGRGIQDAAGKYAGRLAAGKNAAFNTVARDTARNATAGIAKLNNNAIARIGAGAVGAGLAAGAARNAYKAATAKKKAERFRSEMNKAFAGTKYGKGNGGGQASKPRQGKKRRRS
mgnify:CR=1 FL=1